MKRSYLSREQLSDRDALLSLARTRFDSIERRQIRLTSHSVFDIMYYHYRDNLFLCYLIGFTKKSVLRKIAKEVAAIPRLDSDAHFFSCSAQRDLKLPACAILIHSKRHSLKRLLKLISELDSVRAANGTLVLSCEQDYAQTMFESPSEMSDDELTDAEYAAIYGECDE